MRNLSCSVNVRRRGRSKSSGDAAAGAETIVGRRPSSLSAPAAARALLSLMRGITTGCLSYALKGKLPVGLCLIIIATEGFMIKQQGGVNAAVFIEFLKCLIAGAGRVIFLIVDRGPAHIARKTRAFVESLNGSLRLFYLSPYSPDRNPDELVWKHLKADTVGRMAITSKDDFKAKVRSSMRQLQNNPGKLCSFYQKPSLRYAA